MVSLGLLPSAQLTRAVENKPCGCKIYFTTQLCGIDVKKLFIQTSSMHRTKRRRPVKQPLTVACLIERRADAVRQQAFPALPESPVLDVAVARRVALECTEAAKKLTSLAQWFKGAAAAVKDLPRARVVDTDKTLMLAMDELENHLLCLGVQILSLGSNLQALNSQNAALIRDALPQSMQIHTDLLESARAFKWTALEHDHQANLVAGIKR
jgi:hypothetical protein